MKLNSKNLSGPLLLLLTSLGFAPGCGTEIGNGRKPPDLITAGSGQPNASPTASSDSPGDKEGAGAPDTAPKPSQGMVTPLNRLFIACASPIAEMAAGTLDDEIGTDDLVVTESPAKNWEVKVNTATYAVKANASAELPYGIQSTTVTLSTLGCTSVTTGSSTAGVTRTAVYADGYRTFWTLNASQKVKSIVLFDANGSRIGEWKAP